jgi:hypothetical protein
MSALLKPPKKPNEGHGKPAARGRGHTARGRGRGRGRGNVGSRRPGYMEQINVGTRIDYGDGASRHCRFRWPVTITEEQALCEVLKSLPEEDLPLVCQVIFSQAPRNTQRISWLDEEPKGSYYFNQDMYGEDSIQQALPNNINYDPDIPGMQYSGDVNGYTLGGPGHQPQYPVDPRLVRQQERAGPGVRYDANDIWGPYGPPQRGYT